MLKPGVGPAQIPTLDPWRAVQVERLAAWTFDPATLGDEPDRGPTSASLAPRSSAPQLDACRATGSPSSSWASHRYGGLVGRESRPERPAECARSRWPRARVPLTARRCTCASACRLGSLQAARHRRVSWESGPRVSQYRPWRDGSCRLVRRARGLRIGRQTGIDLLTVLDGHVDRHGPIGTITPGTIPLSTHEPGPSKQTVHPGHDRSLSRKPAGYTTPGQRRCDHQSTRSYRPSTERRTSSRSRQLWPSR